jgi:hypothetical protein
LNWRIVILAALFLEPFAVCKLGRTQEPSESNPKSKTKSTASSRGRPAAKKVDPNVVIGRVLDSTNGIQLFAPQSMTMQFGMKFNSQQNYCTNILATIPFPMDWPEQKVTVVSNQIPDQMATQFRDLPAGARQLVMKMAAMPPNTLMDLVVQVQIEKSFINPPPDTSIFRIPSSKTMHKELKWYMGSSPYIDAELSDIRKTAKKIEDSKPDNAWQHVERIYDWVRENIQYRSGGIRQIKEALKDKQGDCEEMTGIFVALCRASDIPARCVWVPEHCYPEFYLEDEDGNGHWFPCQVAGERQFGQMHDYRPILQKGDRFKVPEEQAMQRYVSHFLSCKQRAVIPGARDMEVEPVLDLGPLQAQLNALRQNAAQGQNPEQASTPNP